MFDILVYQRWYNVNMLEDKESLSKFLGELLHHFCHKKRLFIWMICKLKTHLTITPCVFSWQIIQIKSIFLRQKWWRSSPRNFNKLSLSSTILILYNLWYTHIKHFKTYSVIYYTYRTRAIITRGLYIFYPIFQCGL